MDKFKDKQLVSHLTARSITYDTASVHKWTIKDYMIREMDGMKENIVKGDRIDSILFMEPADFLIMKNQQEMMTSPELSEYISRQRQRGFANIKEFELEYHKRIAMSFASFILTLIGVSLSSKKSDCQGHSSSCAQCGRPACLPARCSRPSGHRSRRMRRGPGSLFT